MPGCDGFDGGGEGASVGESVAFRSSSLPRIEQRRAVACEIFGVTRHDYEIVFKRRGKDEAVGHRERLALQFGLSGKNAPTVGDCLGHRQKPGLKPVSQVMFNPLFQAGTALGRGLALNTFAKLAPK